MTPIISTPEAFDLYIPNVLASARGERTLFDRCSSFIGEAQRWLADNITSDDGLQAIAAGAHPELLADCRRFIVIESIAKALPMLDLVFTPSGFGVVQSSNIAPASQQRVDRLAKHLREWHSAIIDGILMRIREVPGWCSSECGAFFGSTLFEGISSIAVTAPEMCDRLGLWEVFSRLQPKAADIEMSLAGDYVSPELLAVLRRAVLEGSLSADQRHVVRALRVQVKAALEGKPISTRHMMAVVDFIRTRPEAFPEWAASQTARLFSPPTFQNDKRSSGYFF